MFNSVKTSEANKIIVTELTRKLNLGPENVIARLAYCYSLSTGVRFKPTDVKDSKGKEYSKTTLFGNNLSNYVAMVCLHYSIYKSDKDIPRYIKMHIDHGLESINKEILRNPSLTGFDFLINKIDNKL